MYVALTLVESYTVHVIIDAEGIDMLSLSDDVIAVDPPVEHEPKYDVMDPMFEHVLLLDEWGGYISHVDQKILGGAIVFRRMVYKYATKIGFTNIFKKNEFARVKAVCFEKEKQNCDWHVHAVLYLHNGNFRIKKT